MSDAALRRREDKSSGIARTGKLSEAVLKRSVLTPLGAGAPRRIPAEGYNGSEIAYAAVCAAPGYRDEPGMLVTAAANRLASYGAQPKGLVLHALLPYGCGEAALKRDMGQIAARARAHGMEILDGHTEVSNAVLRPQYMLTGVGRVQAKTSRLRPGQQLVLTKWIALAGTAAIARAHGQELCARYPAFLVESARRFEEAACIVPEARIALRPGKDGDSAGVCAIHDLSQGGVFGALWEMAEQAGVGLEVDLKKIPVRQETIEICEYFDVNPYCLYSAGALLIGTGDAQTLVAALLQQGIPASVIGRVTDGRARIIRNGEEARYLDRPQQDEWYRRFQ